MGCIVSCDDMVVVDAGLLDCMSLVWANVVGEGRVAYYEVAG